MVGDDECTWPEAALHEEFSETPRTSAEIAAYADAMADMFCAYLKGVAKARTRLAR